MSVQEMLGAHETDQSRAGGPGSLCGLVREVTDTWLLSVCGWRGDHWECQTAEQRPLCLTSLQQDV